MTWLTDSPWFAAAMLFVLGITLGRFLNRCIDRFERYERLSEQLSSLFRLSASERTLRSARRSLHYLPVIGWLVPGNPLSRGRRTDLRHALVELGNGLLLALLVLAEFPEGFHAPPTVDPFAVEGIPLSTPATDSLVLQLVRFLLHTALIESLLVATTIDFQRMIIPDGSTLPTMLLALVTGAAAGGVWLVPVWYEDTQLLAILQFADEFGGGIEVPQFLVEHPHIHGLLVSVAGLIVGGGIVWAVRGIGHWALGREAMGFGDVVLMAMIGAVVGWQPVLTIFFLAPVCAIVVVLVAAISGSSREFPFGPWLSLATVVLLIGWQAVWPYAGRFFLIGRILPFLGIGILILLAVLLKLMRMIRGDRYWRESDFGGSPWTSADQLHYLSQENAGHSRNRLTSDGGRAGWQLRNSGGIGERRWRSQPASQAWLRGQRKR